MKCMSLNLLAFKIIFSGGFIYLFNFWVVLGKTWNYCHFFKMFFCEWNTRVLTYWSHLPAPSQLKVLWFFSFTMIFGLFSIKCLLYIVFFILLCYLYRKKVNINVLWDSVWLLNIFLFLLFEQFKQNKSSLESKSLLG